MILWPRRASRGREKRSADCPSGNGNGNSQSFWYHSPACPKPYYTASDLLATKGFLIFLKGVTIMKHKGKSIQLQQGAVSDLISHIANLPEREKSADDPISLPEIFRTKEFLTEIRGALKRGYSFEDLSQIFSDKCGVSISTRQLKYHYTRWKSKPQKDHRSTSTKPSPSGDKASVVAPKMAEKGVSNDAEIPSIREEAIDSKAVKSGAFVINMQQEEI